MTIDIKICGVSTPDALDEAVARGATHIGFIFFQKSPRHITPQSAAPLSARAQAAGAKSVVVTVNADDGYLDEIVHTVKPAMIQLHGGETPERVAEVKARYGLPVMKAFAIADASDLAKLAPYKGIADRLLLDAKAPKGSNLPGGNGVSFDWSLLSALDGDVDYMLSGGLNAQNVGQAMAIANPPALDISSGVESAPGIKDKDKIAAFFAAVKQAEGTNP